jgi:hypothetical protein
MPKHKRISFFLLTFRIEYRINTLKVTKKKEKSIPPLCHHEEMDSGRQPA